MAENIFTTPTTRSSAERDREKSYSYVDDRQANRGKKVVIEVENHSALLEEIPAADFEAQGFQIRPNFGEKFNYTAVESAIESVLTDFFRGLGDDDKKQYDQEKAGIWTIEVGKLLTTKVRQFNYPRYKLVSTVVLGEQIGGGIHVGMKCLWDADTDSYATYTYMTDTIFCIGTVCGVYYY